MSKRLALSRFLEALHIRKVLARITKPELIVLNYHRIYDGRIQTDFDEGVFGHSSQIFEEQVAWLSKNYNVLGESELIAFLNGQHRDISKPAAVITFDDGYIDNFTLAFPTLKKYGVPAIFFVPFTNIEQRELGWWDLAAWCIKRTEVAKINVDGQDVLLDSETSKRQAIKLVQNIFKAKDFEDTKDLIFELSSETQVALPSQDVQGQELMTWAQLSEMVENGMYIGSHTMTHRLLSRISNEDQDWEISTSKSCIEEKLKSQVRSIAYPVGQRESFNAHSMIASQAAGYDLAFSFYSGFYKNSLPERFDIKRVCLSDCRSLFVSELLAPGIFLPK